MTYYLIARPNAIDRILNFFARNTPIPPDPNVASLHAELLAFKAAHDQQISALGVQIEHERTERRDARRYAEMLQGSLETVTKEASTFATELYNLRETHKQTDERLKWQNDTIGAMKLQIKELEDTVAQLTKERAGLIHERQVDQARISWLTQENAMLRGIVPAEQLAIVDERMNTGALRRSE